MNEKRQESTQLKSELVKHKISRNYDKKIFINKVMKVLEILKEKYCCTFEKKCASLFKISEEQCCCSIHPCRHPTLIPPCRRRLRRISS
ncbi:unnamed protein product [Moneuplotes crassus]|uniref:Uncharacterized protein n=1 Tax=Euplotes crassus TaxID=5936 RepID=A0AAD2D8I6_EUPCR|nr:unnamed protein product [Moneuplotes crassus]